MHDCNAPPAIWQETRRCFVVGRLHSRVQSLEQAGVIEMELALFGWRRNAFSMCGAASSNFACAVKTTAGFICDFGSAGLKRSALYIVLPLLPSTLFLQSTP